MRVGGQPVLVTDLAFSYGPLSLAEGRNGIEVTATDCAGNARTLALDVTLDTVPPVITVTSPSSPLLTNQAQLIISGSLNEPATLTIGGALVAVTGSTFSSPPITLREGLNSIELVATDAAGNAGTATVDVTLDTVPPVAIAAAAVTASQPSGGVVHVSAGPGAAEAGATVRVTGPSASASGVVLADGSFALDVAAAAKDLLQLVLVDAAGNVSTVTQVTVPGPPPPPDGLPPDPATVAPALDLTAPTELFAAVEFLWTGPPPIQTGVVPGAIEKERVAVLRGRVTTVEGEPLTGVAITVHDHPELGRTLSRADGHYDLAVNGGDAVTVELAKTGYLPAQRTIATPWRDYRTLDDVVLAPLDSVATTVQLGSDQLQVARGSVSRDADGERRATLMIPAGTGALMRAVNGDETPLSVMTVRASEYTVGPLGHFAMPAALPPSVAYTYAVELSADEAIAAGAATVEFDRPLYLYVENFLQFPVGIPVPAAHYDRKAAAWKGSENGLVVGIQAVDGIGRAVIDVTGSGAPATGQQLADLGFTDAELIRIASLYGVGQSLWRTPITHFTPWDCNWPYAPPDDAESPPDPKPEKGEGGDPEDAPDCSDGSVIECQNQTLGEMLPIVGTPFTLNYQSDRGQGATSTPSRGK